MVPYDRPHVTHDMILRFMGVDFSALTGGSAQIPSNVGVDFKPSFQPVVDENKPQSGTTVPGIVKTPEQDKAMWEGIQPSSNLRGQQFTIATFQHTIMLGPLRSF